MSCSSLSLSLSSSSFFQSLNQSLKEQVDSQLRQIEALEVEMAEVKRRLPAEGGEDSVASRLQEEIRCGLVCLSPYVPQVLSLSLS